MEEFKQSLGDRMKYYEKLYDISFVNNNIYIIRLDGNGFSKRIKQWNLKKPFDANFHWAMVDTCKNVLNLVSPAKLIWTGSDEISILCISNEKSETWFNNRLNKVLSLSASYCTAYFNKFMKDSGFDINNYPGFFDARIIAIPNFEEAVNNLLSRYNDCKRNSISMWSDFFYSHKSLMNKNSTDKIAMLKEKGFDWYSDALPWTKYGTFIYKETVCYNQDRKVIATGDKAVAQAMHEGNYIRNEAKSIDGIKDINMFEFINKLLNKKEGK